MQPFCFLVLAAAVIASSTQLTSNVLPLHRRAKPSNSSRHISSLASAQHGTVFDVEVKFGNQSFLLLVDTGSSDTWVVQTGFQCINGTDNTELPQEACGYANKTYDISPTFKKIPDQSLGVMYGAGIVSGIVGFEDVTLAGMTVKRQEVGVVNKATNPGDGIDSGLIGLGYPSLTSAHPGTNISNTSFLFDRKVYMPLLNSMHQQGLINPYFALAIQRAHSNTSTGHGGYLALGSLPPVTHSPEFATTPVEVTKAVPLNVTSGKQQLSFWTITVKGAVFQSSGYPYSNSTPPFEAVVDSGNPMNFLPHNLAASVNAAFSPPAIPVPSSPSIYTVECNATPPAFGLMIGNQTFFHAGEDLIINNGDGTCISGLGDGDAAGFEGVVLYFLGDAFLKNVVAVFDFGKHEMRFAATGNSSGSYGGAPTSTAPYATPNYTVTGGAATSTAPYATPSYTVTGGAATSTAPYATPSYTMTGGAATSTAPDAAPSYAVTGDVTTSTAPYAAPGNTVPGGVTTLAAPYAAPSYAVTGGAAISTESYAVPSFIVTSGAGRKEVGMAAGIALAALMLVLAS